MVNQAIIKKCLILALIITSLLYLVAGLIYKPIVSGDALKGFISLHNYLHGGDWNKSLTFKTDGSGISSNELTWWAPGQYEIAYILSKLINVNVGTAIIIISFLALTGGGYFYYRIFKRSSLSANVVIATLLILFLQRFININFLQYSSSDLILFFYTPFYVFIYLNYKTFKAGDSWYILPLLLLLNLFGLFIKNSFLLFESAFSMFLLIDMVTIERSKISSKQFKATTILKRLLLLLPFIISLFIYYWFFLRHGDNPANGSGILINASTILSGVFKPVIGVLFSSLSITAIWGNFQDKASIASLYANILIAVFLLTLAIIIYRNRNKVINKCKKDEVFGMALILSLMYILFWLLFTVKQSYISNEDRLFLPVTILVLPYLISGGISASKSMKYICISLICFSLLYGVSTFIFRIRAYNKSLSIMSESPDIKGFKVFKDDNGGLNDLRNINKILADGYANNYLVIIDPEDAFLLNVTNRFIVCDIKLVPDMVGLKSLSHSEKYFMLTKHRGNVSFLNWRKIYESPRYDLYQTN